jgi:hypothetical protein
MLFQWIAEKEDSLERLFGVTARISVLFQGWFAFLRGHAKFEAHVPQPSRGPHFDRRISSDHRELIGVHPPRELHQTRTQPFPIRSRAVRRPAVTSN